MLVVPPDAAEAPRAAFDDNGIKATVHDDAIQTQGGVPVLAALEFAPGTEQEEVERVRSAITQPSGKSPLS